MIAALIPVLAPLLGNIVKKVIEGKTDAANIDAEIQLAMFNQAGALEKIQGDIVKAEANSAHVITAIWRPLLMLVIIAIVAMNYLVLPVLNMITGIPLELVLPTELWTLLQIGVGGYIVGRTGEKMVSSWKE